MRPTRPSPYLLLLWCLWSVVLPSPGQSAREPVNPALIYWQCTGLMKEPSREDHAFITAFPQDPRPALDKARVMLGQQKAALDRFLKAAQSSAACDWGLTFDDGPFMPMPHLAKMQTLCRLTLMQARVAIHDGHHEDALKRLLAVHRAARHVGSGDLLVTALVQYGLESQAITVTGQALANLDPAARREHLAALQSLPPLHSVAESLQGERNFAEWAGQQAADVASFYALQKALASSSGSSLNSPAAVLPEGSNEDPYAGLTPELQQQWVADLQKYYAEAATALAKPWKAAVSSLKEIEGRARQSNPLVRSAFPSMTASRDTQARTESQLAMLMAALEQGPGLNENTSQKYIDAFEGQPFYFRKNKDNTVTLYSHHKVRNKEVSLTLTLPEETLPSDKTDSRKP